jgi:hypothetical protein
VKLYCCEDRTAPFFDVYRKTAHEHGYSVVYPDIGLVKTKNFSKFMAVYRHLSINPIDFELACFRRYFIILSLVKPNERFIISDSDLYFNTDVSKIPEQFMEFNNGLVGSVGVANGLAETDIAPHFSIWTMELLAQFVEYLIYCYEERTQVLESIYSQRISQKGQRVAISDMTILHDWIIAQKVPFLNSNQVVDGLYFDHNISLCECLNSEFRGIFGRKRIIFNDNGFSLLDVHDREVCPIFLHLQGRYKITSKPLYSRNKYIFYLLSLYIYSGRAVRSLLNK